MVVFPLILLTFSVTVIPGFLPEHQQADAVLALDVVQAAVHAVELIDQGCEGAA
jgi:hypothetical protein